MSLILSLTTSLDISPGAAALERPMHHAVDGDAREPITREHISDRASWTGADVDNPDGERCPRTAYHCSRERCASPRPKVLSTFYPRANGPTAP